MITIANVSNCGKECKNIGGIHEYEIRINGRLITKFKHKRKDGLGKLFLEAAKAVELNNWLQIFHEMDKHDKLQEKKKIVKNEKS